MQKDLSVMGKAQAIPTTHGIYWPNSRKGQGGEVKKTLNGRRTTKRWSQPVNPDFEFGERS